ncbi:hypothetical protein R1flu_018390 [Riccia fluitans]|uniref:Uncharacterized protein n=1 Tax=Riccia fluitans TaxID=41844 RepID=A0ABD1ZFW6_9MARC
MLLRPRVTSSVTNTLLMGLTHTPLPGDLDEHKDEMTNAVEQSQFLVALLSLEEIHFPLRCMDAWTA